MSLYTLKGSQNTGNSLELRDGFISSEAVSEVNCLVDVWPKEGKQLSLLRDGGRG